ncbi:MAG TPA: hypothetical protein VM864_10720, partial [Pyrinomonadaceae bacterium]|nr:hypothetical protein [Pyrinomonadaceae bacterium]
MRFPSAEVEFIIGPQLKSGSALNPVPWYDQNALSRGLELGEAFPANPPGSVLLPGTISVTQNSNQITGAGTHFVQDFATGPNAYFVIHDAGGAHPFIRGSVTDDTHMAVTAPWPGRSSAGLKYGGMSADELDSFTNLNYYDQGLVQYTNYYRTGDARFLSYARKINDSWWKSTYVSEGRTPIDNSFSPRTSSLAGLMLRALDGRPEMWPWITDYVRQQLHLWVSLRADYAGFYYGIRDGGYMLLHAANLARVHPDPAVRAEFRAKALDGAVRYYARLQGPDGGFYFDLDDIKGTTQPFQEGILAEGLIAVHRL